MLKLINNISYSFFSASIFRIMIGLVLLVDTSLNLFYANKFYRINGFIYSFDSQLFYLSYVRNHIELFFIFYIILLLMLIFGIGKNITVIGVFIFYLIEVLLIDFKNSWGDTILLHTLLYFIFVQSFSHFSLFRYKKKASLLNKLATVSIMLHVCYIYLSNGIHKVEDETWFNGYAFAYFIDYFKPYDIFNLSQYIPQKNVFVMKGINFLVILYQIMFCFLVWFKKTKYAVLITGVVMHLIMAFMLHLYKFELILILHYLFFVYDKDWVRLKILEEN